MSVCVRACVCVRVYVCVCGCMCAAIPCALVLLACSAVPPVVQQPQCLQLMRGEAALTSTLVIEIQVRVIIALGLLVTLCGV